MFRYLALILALTIFAVNKVQAQNDNQESVTVDTEEEDDKYYSTAWLGIDLKAIIDNDRLVKRYKACILAEKLDGCPRDVTAFKKIIPEVLDTVCGKCLPVHIEKVKETLEYICLHRRADLEEVKAKMDPTGELEAKFVAKYGDLSCKH